MPNYQPIVLAWLDGQPADPATFTYSELSIDHKLPAFQHRFILEVEFEELMRCFGPGYEASMRVWRGGGGTGDDHVDSLGWPSLDYLKANDRLFNEFILDSLYHELLDSLLPNDHRHGYVITSLEGIFCRPPTLYVFGGCSKAFAREP